MAHVRLCKIEGCKCSASTKGYCRLHYLRHWRDIKENERCGAARRLDKYIDSICRSNPDNFVEVIREDMNSDDFESRVEARLESESELESIEDPVFEEEIERLIRELKVEKGF